MGFTASSMDSSSVSTLFSSINNSNNFFGASKSMMGQNIATSNSMLSDWYSIKTGSYSKLVKAYYTEKPVDKNKTNKLDENKDISDTYTNASKVKSASSALKDASFDLMSSDLYKEDKRSDLYNALSDFVDSYNSMISVGAKSDSSSVNKTVDSMKSYTDVSKKLLSEVGVSVSTSGRLSIDEDAFKQANDSALKSLFASRGSYASQINALASSANTYASSQLSYGYTAAGAYNYGTSSTYNTYM